MPELPHERTSELSEARWEEHFGEINRLKAPFREPYVQAVSPHFASAIGSLKKRRIRILVVGGGDGHFSKHLLPRVREQLGVLGKKIAFSVVESDLFPVVKRAPVKARVQADMSSLPFADGSFDVVVGESVLHQVGPAGIEKALSEIGRVLSKHGVFIHVQDNIPDRRFWLTPEQQLLLSGAERLHEAAKAAHHNLSNAIAANAKETGFKFSADVVNSSVLVPDSRLEFEDRLPPGQNRVIHCLGAVGVERTPDVPAGKREFVYKGIVTVLRKASAKPSPSH